jgi:hypothetical protein
MGPLIAWLTLTIGLAVASRTIEGFELGLRAAAAVALSFGIFNWGLGWLLFTKLGIATLGVPLLLGVEFVLRWAAYALVLKLTASLLRTACARRWAPALLVAAPLSLVSLVVDYMV